MLHYFSTFKIEKARGHVCSFRRWFRKCKVYFNMILILKLQLAFETLAERVFRNFPYLGNGKRERVECGVKMRVRVNFIHLFNTT